MIRDSACVLTNIALPIDASTALRDGGSKSLPAILSIFSLAIAVRSLLPLSSAAQQFNDIRKLLEDMQVRCVLI